MNATWTRIAALLLLAAPALAEEREIMLGLRDGGVLWGSIADHDERAIEFLRLDNGGRVRIPWSLLDPRFERNLRERLGYLDLAQDEVFVKADLLRTVDGAEIVGMIVHRTEEAIHVKTANKLVAVPKVRIAGPSTLVRVPALDVFTKAELYRRERSAREAKLGAPGAAGAPAHFELAQFCERILDYGNAVAHYRRAGELDPSFRPNDLSGALARAVRKEAAQEQVDSLGEIRRERQRGKFERALELVAAFPGRFPESPLFEELYELRRSVLRAREEELVGRIERLWHGHAEKLTQRAARELGFAQAVTWVEEAMGEDVLAAVHGDALELDPELTVEDVRDLWTARARRRTRRASYGVGTFLLGDDRAREGVEEGGNGASETSARDAAREDLEDRIRRFLDQQQVASRSRSSGAGSQVDPAEFWTLWSVAGRSQWLLAHYAEHGGDMELRNLHFRACRECAGSGILERIYSGAAVTGSSGGRTRRVTCPTCQRVGIVRRVSYR